MPTQQTIEAQERAERATSTGATTTLFITGMTCANCARHVTEAIQSVPGVRAASVSLHGRLASVHSIAGREVNVPAIIQAVEEAGYGARVLETPGHEHVERTLAGWQL